MPRRILISPLGTGSLNKENTTEREYRPVTYRIGGKEYNETFISKALSRHLNIDTVFLIGTVKSMWEEAYEVYGKETSYWDEYQWAMLADKINIASWDTDPQSFDLTLLEKVLGDKAKAFIIKYGIDEEEMMENWEYLSHIEEYLEDGDIVYFDITHAFRSMAFYILTVLNYIIDVSEKKIEVGGVFYGMLDIVNETGYAPIVDLKPLYEIFRWSRGAYSFLQHGNGYEIAALVNDEKLSNLIKSFSDAININFLGSIKSKMGKLEKQKKRFSQMNGPGRLIIPRVIDEFLDYFNEDEPPYLFQLNAAKWYFKKKRYGEAFMALTESIVTYNCFRLGLGSNWEDKDPRDESKGDILNSRPKHPLKDVFLKMNEIRRCIAHHSDKFHGNHSISNYIDDFEKDAVMVEKEFLKLHQRS